MMPKSEANFFKRKQRHKTVADFSVFGKEPLNKSNAPLGRRVQRFLTGAQFCHAAPALAKIEPRRRSELKRRTLPGIVSGLRASERIIRIAPAFACIAPGSAPPHIQPTLA